MWWPAIACLGAQGGLIAYSCYLARKDGFPQYSIHTIDYTAVFLVSTEISSHQNFGYYTAYVNRVVTELVSERVSCLPVSQSACQHHNH
ncbi:hypothetical protein TIFTF001_017030 [Ficus carica]|uniref:Uncharacterized protein n=1 Tax=Ficus carica TaxID=3494 RepID=A0AA88A476_FICCA|nr:hypothetical protein TIFTF001_017030 [Ficus carica]